MVPHKSIVVPKFALRTLYSATQQFIYICTIIAYGVHATFITAVAVVAVDGRANKTVSAAAVNDGFQSKGLLRVRSIIRHARTISEMRFYFLYIFNAYI